jgi:hypothetical protein
MRVCACVYVGMYVCACARVYVCARMCVYAYVCVRVILLPVRHWFKIPLLCFLIEWGSFADGHSVFFESEVSTIRNTKAHNISQCQCVLFHNIFIDVTHVPCLPWKFWQSTNDTLHFSWCVTKYQEFREQDSLSRRGKQICNLRDKWYKKAGNY